MDAIEKNNEAGGDVRSRRLANEVWRDLRYAGRVLGRSPGFASLAVAVMALAIGANTAVFSVVSAVLLKPLPYADADRIVTLSSTSVPTGERNPLVTIANFRDWRAQSSTFEAMATYRGGELPASPGAGQAEYARGAIVDADFFRVFGVQPSVGRSFVADETILGGRNAGGRDAVVISYRYWQTRFGGDADVLDRTVVVNNIPRPVVGVLPEGFAFPRGVDLWLPEQTPSTSRTNHGYFAVGRIKATVSIEQAQAELASIAAGLAQQYPESNQGRGVALAGLQDQLVGNVRTTLYLLWGVVGVVLLIACANTATLLLGKATARTREIAVRAALGASRGRIVRQLIAESLLLAIVAGLFGVLVAAWGADLLAALTPADVVRLADPRIDRGVLAFTFGVSLLTSVLFGLIPALQASKVDLVDALKAAGTVSVVGGRAARTRSVLVVCEIALAVVLLTGAGLLVKSLIALHEVDLGYEPRNVLVMKATGVRPMPETNAFFRDVTARLAVLPGVVAVGAAMILPGDLSNAGSGSYFIDKRPPAVRDRTQDPFAYYNVITPGSFAAAGIPLKIGRDFNDGDAGDSPLVAIVNEALVRKSLGGENPIGRTIFCSFDRSNDPMTIVGVVGDVRQNNPAIAPAPDCYMPYTQHAYNSRTLHVIIRTSGDPLALAGAARQIAAERAADVPVSFTTMEDTLWNSVEGPRFRAVLIGVFAGLAVCLAMAGVYGLVAFAIQQRSREMGLRMALGASKESVQRLILWQGLTLCAIGVALGLTAAAAATRLLTTMLFEVAPLDLTVYAAVVLALVAVTLAASYLPARRATLLDPARILRAE